MVDFTIFPRQTFYSEMRALGFVYGRFEPVGDFEDWSIGDVHLSDGIKFPVSVHRKFANWLIKIYKNPYRLPKMLFTVWVRTERSGLYLILKHANPNPTKDDLNKVDHFHLAGRLLIWDFDQEKIVLRIGRNGRCRSRGGSKAIPNRDFEIMLHGILTNPKFSDNLVPEQLWSIIAVRKETQLHIISSRQKTASPLEYSRPIGLPLYDRPQTQKRI